MKEVTEKEFWETVQRTGEIKRSFSHPVVEFFSLQRIQYMKKFLNFDSIITALDVGCGTGFSSYYIPSSIQTVGNDFSRRNLELNPLKDKFQASGYSLPFASDSFDLVYCWDFLHHLEEPEKAVKEMARVAKKYLVLFEPNRNNPIQFIYGLTKKSERGTLNFHKEKLRQFAKQIKFKLISCETVGWVFAGTTPLFSLGIHKKLPFVHKFGISAVLICEK